MKNCDEMVNSLLERREQYAVEQRRKRKVLVRAVTSISCVCLVVLLGFGMWRGGVFGSKPPVTLDDSTIIGGKDYIDPDELDNSQTLTTGNNDSTIVGEKDYVDPDGLDNSNQTTTSNGNDSYIQHDPARIMWTINRVESSISAAKLNFSSDKYYSEKKTLADITAYLGRDLSTLEPILPQGFEFFGRYETEFFYKLSGELAYDSCVFGYKKDNQQITIKVSKIGVPYDCLYELKDPTISKLNGVEVTMGGIYKVDNPEEFELVFADFSHEGLQYRVTVENVPFDGTKDIPIWLACIVGELTK